MKFVNWQYCKDLNDINEAIKNQDEDWEGLIDASQIISITYNIRHECYVVFWTMEGSSNFIQLKQNVLNNKQLWIKLREIEDEDSD